MARHPSEIKVSEILHALEGACCLVDCVDDDDYCDRIPICATYEIWNEASKLLRNYFDGISLQELIKIHDKKNPKGKTKSKAKGH